MTVRTAPDGLADLALTPGRPFGIYIHVPFCATRCGYCDFNTYTPAELGGANPDGWLAALRIELALAAERLGSTPAVDTVFVGGGTPSLLGGTGPGRGAGRGPRPLHPGPRRRGHHRGEPRVHLTAAVRAAARGRLHPGVARHAVGGAARPRGAGPGALAGPGARRGARRPRRRLRARQPRPDLRHAGGDRRRPAAFGGRRRRGQRRPRVRVRPGRRGRHGAGPPGAARRGQRTRQRRAGAPLRTARRAAVGGGSRAGTRSPTGACPAASAGTTSATGTAANGGAPGRARTATSARPGGGMSSTPTPMRRRWPTARCRWPTSSGSTPRARTPRT